MGVAFYDLKFFFLPFLFKLSVVALLLLTFYLYVRKAEREDFYS